MRKLGVSRTETRTPEKTREHIPLVFSVKNGIGNSPFMIYIFIFKTEVTNNPIFQVLLCGRTCCFGCDTEGIVANVCFYLVPFPSG